VWYVIGMDPSVALTCHPHTRTDAVRAIRVHVSRMPAGDLRLDFLLVGELARLRLPATRAPCVGRDLWRHTCFEAFVAVDGASPYHELNFSPAREWAVLAFRRYREGAPLADDVPAPAIVVRATRDRLELGAIVPLARLAPAYARAPLRLAVAAVVEETSGAFSYWSLHHPAAAPDFHHDAGFVLRLEPPAGAC
jgi:hypothetical protein